MASYAGKHNSLNNKKQKASNMCAILEVELNLALELWLHCTFFFRLLAQRDINQYNHNQILIQVNTYTQ